MFALILSELVWGESLFSNVFIDQYFSTSSAFLLLSFLHLCHWMNHFIDSRLPFAVNGLRAMAMEQGKSNEKLSSLPWARNNMAKWEPTKKQARFCCSLSQPAV
jgi:hypothetical protein